MDGETKEKYRQQFEKVSTLIEHGVKESKHLTFVRRTDKNKKDIIGVRHDDEPGPAFSLVMLESGGIMFHILGKISEKKTPLLEECPDLARSILRDMGVSPEGLPQG